MLAESLVTPAQLIEMLAEARSRTIDLVSDLSEEQLMGPRLQIVNPPLWEIGHVAWFQEKWALRHLRGRPPISEKGDSLYDSAAIAHDTRWSLPLPNRADTIKYMSSVLEAVSESLRNEPSLSQDEAYFNLLPLYHEYMHAEAFAYTRQTLAYSEPVFRCAAAIHPAALKGGSHPAALRAGPHPGDAAVPGGRFMLGATEDIPFVFDNEKWAHPVQVAPFRIARAPVTNAEFKNFVEDDGYRSDRWWSPAGLAWRETAKAEHPVYWQKQSGGRWMRRRFNQLVTLESNLPVVHVNWFEAEAYCNWAGRRLPTEVEWEFAASAELDAASAKKRRYPWGDNPPEPHLANLDWIGMDCAEVGAYPDGDSAFGCRQMIGNVWEWTASDFLPYPGFVADPYKEYSEPWFGDHKVLRGGCWTTRSDLVRNTWRNFYTPDRRDVWAGFRTCAITFDSE